MRSGQPIPSRCGLTRGFAFVTALGVVMGTGLGTTAGCASTKPRLAPSALPSRPEGALEVVLELDGAADLDLHVSDPQLETVYFGNSPSSNGGVLDRDVRCEVAVEDDARRETVRFEAPLRGRYRVGVDYVRACRRFRRGAHFSVRVIAPGLELERTGEIAPGHFEHKLLEFDWPPPAD